MKSITLHSHVGEDGILQLSVPVGMKNVDLEVMVIVQPIAKSESAKTPEELGWTPGFFERTFGAWEGEPLTREDQGELQEREPLE